MKKNNQRVITYISCNAEVASKNIQNVTIENISNTYSIANEIRYNVDNAIKKLMFYKQFVTLLFGSVTVVL